MKSPSEEAHKPTCFVIMPFTSVKSNSNKYQNLGIDELDTIYDIYKTIFEERGYSVNRSDSVGDILAELIYSLDTSDLVIADLTGLNPNVMYELGIRHGIIKKTLVTSQDIKELPFDLGKYYCLEYGWKTKKEKELLRINIDDFLIRIETNPNIKYGPVHAHLGEKSSFNISEKNAFLNQLDAVSGELTIIIKTYRHELEILLGNYPDSILNDGTTRYFDQSKIPKKKLLEKINYTKQFEYLFSLRFPAIEYSIAQNRILDFLNKFEDMSSLNIMLRNQYVNLFATKEYTLKELINALWLSQAIRSDFAKLRVAIDQDKYGENLDFESKYILKSIK